MSINLTDEIEVKTKKGKLGAAKQIFLDGDKQTVEKEIQDINSRHSALNTKHESLSKTVQGIAATGGASIATNVTYNNNTSRLNAENTQDAIDEIASKKFDKESIIQEFGDSEELVMSQKAVSDKFSNLSSTITEIEEKANNASTDASNALKKAEAAGKASTTNKQNLDNAVERIGTLEDSVNTINTNMPKMICMTETAYEALEKKEADTYYMLTEE